MINDLKPKTDDELQSIVQRAIEDAVSFVNSEIAEERNKAQRYFEGRVDIEHEEGRSKVVSTKCRDVVRATKPPLMRAFMATDKPVEFVPKGPEDVAMAEQKTAYAKWKFEQKNGYGIVQGAFHDALVKKQGVVKVYWEDYSEADIEEFSGYSDEQIAMLVQTPDVEIVEHELTDEGHAGKFSRVDSNGDVCFDLIAPEDFFVNAEAVTLDDAYCCGHRNNDMRVGDLLEMGYDYEEVIDYAGDEDDAMAEEADLNRRGYVEYDSDESSEDPTMRRILVTEAYMKVDVEGVGAPQLYRFTCLGSSYHMLDYELADDVPFAVFEVDPEPHTFFGRSLVELIMDDQDAATSMLRGIIDNIHLTNSPGAQVLDASVNMEDFLNNEIGRVVRVKQMGAIEYDAVPFTAGSTLPAMQYYDEQIENKTGVSRASMGLNPDILQNTTAAAVNVFTEAASGHVELMARNLAEGGMTRMFMLIAEITHKHVDRPTMMRLDGQYVEVDPRSWTMDMDISANVGLGTGGEVEKEMVMREMLQHQFQIWSAYGPGNGLVTLTGIRNTLADIAKLGGVHNVDKYIQPMNPQIEQQMMQQMQAAAQAEQQGMSDPAAMMVQGEIQKAQINAQAKVTTDMAKLQQKAAADAAKLKQDGTLKVADMQMDAMKANQQADIQRDDMVQQRILEAAKLLGEYGIRVDQNAIQREQAANNATN